MNCCTPITSGKCVPPEEEPDRATVVGLDGSLMYLPDANFELDGGTCGNNWFPGAFG